MDPIRPEGGLEMSAKIEKTRRSPWRTAAALLLAMVLALGSFPSEAPAYYPGPPGPPPPGPGPYPPDWWGHDYHHHDDTGAIIAGLALGALVLAAATSQPAPTPTPVPAPVPSGQSWQQIEVNGVVYYKAGDQFLRPFVQDGQVVYQVVPNPIS
jgi:hypothetical protein